MSRLRIGDVVHYVHGGGAHLPAIVMRCPAHLGGTVDLQVLTDDGLVLQSRVQWAGPLPDGRYPCGTWHRPEDA